MKSRNPQRLNKRQVRNYLQNHNCSLAPLLQSQIPEDLSFSFYAIYHCAHDNILAVSRDCTGNLYDSVADWQAHLEELIDLAKREPVHILYRQIPNRERFIQEIPVLIANLAEELELDLSQLDKTLKSLAIVDRALASKQRECYSDSSPRILGSLIAYVGEVLKVAIDGEWEIDEDRGTEWEPAIKDSNGKTYSFCILVFDEIYEAEKSCFYDLTSMLIEACQR